MSFTLTEEQQMLKDLAAEFAAKEITPYAADWDDEACFPQETIRKMGDLGMMGIMVSPKHGGAGLDTTSYSIIMEEIAAACASTAVTMSVHNSLFCGAIEKSGTDGQIKKYLHDFATGKKLGAFALSEPGTGSDAAAQRTLAKLDGNVYRLNGMKNFITSGPNADAMILFAMTAPEKRHKGISAFIVEKDFPGFQVGTIEKKMGLRASQTSEIILDNCEVPKENLMGEEGGGLTVAFQLLDAGRIGIASQALGIAREAFETAAHYANVREAFGKKIGQFEGIQWKLADMATKIDAARLLIRRASWLKDSGKPCSKEASMAKLFSSEMAVDVTREAIQVLGGYGYSKGHSTERNYRDAKVTEIYEGTSEIQRIVISRAVLKEFA